MREMYSWVITVFDNPFCGLGKQLQASISRPDAPVEEVLAQI